MNKNLIAFVLGLASCLPCRPAFAVEVAARINAPQAVDTTVEFAANAAGTGEITFTWDFGDGTKSEPTTDGVATHTYDAPGHYPVIVTARDENGVRTDSFLQTIHRTLSSRRPTSSSTIVFDSERGRVCNVNSDNDTVSCLSTDTFEVEFEVPVGRHPRTLAIALDGTIWVTNQDDSTVSVLDSAGGLLHTVQLKRAAKPFGIAMNPVRGVAYVSLQGSGELVELDLSNGRVLRTTGAGSWPTGVAVDPGTDRIFVTRFISPEKNAELTEVDAEDFSVVRTFSLDMDPGPDGEGSSRGVPNYLRSITISPDGTSAWIPSKKDNTERGEARDGEALTFETSVRTIVSLIDLKENEEALGSRVDLNNRSLGLNLTFSAIGDYAFVALLGNNGVEVLDAYNGKVVAGAFELGNAPDGLVLDDEGHLYVNSFLSRSVVILDARGVLASTNFALDVIDEVVVSSLEKLDQQVLLGKRVFYDASDPRMAQDGYISCAACHLDGFEDGRVWDFTDRGEGLRNTTSLLGRRGVGQGPLHWSANFDEVQDFEHDIRGPFGGTGFLSDEQFKEGSRNMTLGDKKAGLSEELDALDAYVTSLDSVNPSPYRDEDGSLTDAGWRGLELFEELDCPSCHGGADFTDSAQGLRHDVGTLTADSGQRLGGPLDGLDTPTLRGIWETAPYLHDGSAATLQAVLVDRNEKHLHGDTEGLSEDQLEDLVSYLLQIDNVAREDEEEPVDEEEAARENQSGGSCSATTPRGRSSHLAVLLALMLIGHASRRRRSLKKAVAMVAAWPLLACTGELIGPSEGSYDTGSGTSTDGSDEHAPFEPQAGMLRRLTRSQFRNAIFDLTGVTIDVQELEADSFNGEFATVGASTVVTSNVGAEQYLAAAEQATTEVFSSPARAEDFLGCAPVVGDDSCFRSFVARVGRRAWRRPLGEEEVERLVGVAHLAEVEFSSALEGVRWGTTALLASPNFIYRPELGTKEGNDLEISGYEMASRLSFLLWNTLPDEQLLDEAEAGSLSTPEGVVKIASRMLEDPRGSEAVEAFAEDYMRLDRIVHQAKDPALFPQYGPALKEAMVVDMRQTWSSIALERDGDLLDLFSTTTVFVNPELADLYGLDPSGIEAQSFVERSLPADGPRAGILSKAGFLSQFANQVEGSPTLRGKFIREALLCTTIPAPPGDVALELPEASPDTPTTKRDRLAMHRTEDSCANCHAMMDPLGLPLEQFDAIGEFRTTELGLTIDPTGELDGIPVDDAKHLGTVMSAREAIAECLVRKYFSYALGRVEQPTDEGTIEALSTSFEQSGHRFRQLIVDLVSTDAFSVVLPQSGVLP